MLKFVSIVEEIGFVPGDDILPGFEYLPALISHTSKYNWDVNLNSLYLNSLKTGTISPETYGWYLGYNRTYFKKEPLLHFTKNADYFTDLSNSEVKRINNERKKVGLKKIPAVLWNSFTF